jgi:hypothetical protein
MQDGNFSALEFFATETSGTKASNVGSEPASIKKPGCFDKLSLGAPNPQFANQQENRNRGREGHVDRF